MTGRELIKRLLDLDEEYNCQYVLDKPLWYISSNIPNLHEKFKISNGTLTHLELF